MNFTSKNNYNQVLVPYKNYPGGPGTFIINLTNNFNDHRFTQKFNVRNRIILVIVAYSLTKLLILKYIFGLKIILRMDGFRKPSINRMKLIRFTINYTNYLNTLIIYKFLADFVIFQSLSSKLECISALGITNVKSSIIFNGVKELRLYKKKIIKINKLRLVYWGSYINLEQFRMIMLLQNRLKISGYDVQFDIIGRDLSGLFMNNKNKFINFHGLKPYNFICSIAHDSDIFLMLKGSPCANSLIEALSFGLPIVGYSNGGNKEILGNKTGKIFLKSKTEAENLNKFVNGIELVLTNYHKISENASNRYTKKFSRNKMSFNYWKIFKLVLIGQKSNE